MPLFSCSPGFLVFLQTLAGVLAGSLVSGVQLAVSMSNTGGAWDNAKKYIEAGNTEHARELGGKGSDCHKAAVIGDTVSEHCGVCARSVPARQYLLGWLMVHGPCLWATSGAVLACRLRPVHMTGSLHANAGWPGRFVPGPRCAYVRGSQPE